MAEEKQKPLTREDVLRLIEENGGTAEGLDLSEKRFEKGIDLHKLNLEGIILKDAHLEEAHLWGAHLERAFLEGAHLEGADLSDAHLEGADLYDANLEGAILFDAHLEKAHLMHAHLEKAHLNHAHLQGAHLTRAHLEGAYLFQAKLSPDTKLENADWGNYILGEEKERTFAWAEDTYRRLKIWYTEHGMYNIAGEFFFREMEAKRKGVKWWPNPLPRAWSKFLSLICGYGERPLRVIGWAASVISGSALIYFGIGTLTPSTFLDCLYYSAASFTALGYGSWVKEATGWVKGLGVFESFIGVFTIALFLITFIRKMAR